MRTKKIRWKAPVAPLLLCYAMLVSACSPDPVVVSEPTSPALHSEKHTSFGERIEERAALVRSLRRNGVADEPVLSAMGRVPRHVFVPATERDDAYRDEPQPIGYGQTISQPYVVAYMTELLDIAPGRRVLEVGTGSGYQAAVLAELGAVVYSIEIIEPVAARARELLHALGYTAIELRVADGAAGWPEAAPFDAIVVTAAAPQPPPALLEQLAPAGRLVIPLDDDTGTAQWIWLYEKRSDGTIAKQRKLPVRFVPLTGAETR